MTTENLIRSILSVPGNRPAMLEKARSLPADALHLDLEDAVPPSEKERARQTVRQALPGFALQGQMIVVRVNSLSTGLTEADLDAVLCPHLNAISLPKAESAQDVARVDSMLAIREKALGQPIGKIGLLVWIETPKAVLEASQIASASERTVALLLGADDFTREMGIPRTKEGQELDFARWMVALAARAAGVLAIDTGYPDFRDEEGLVKEAWRARRMGFQGKFLIHPGQIDPVNQVFSPSPEEAREARRVLDAFEEALARGHATTSLDGSLIDTAIAGRARRILDLSKQAQRKVAKAEH
ncbi:MAG: CoA ester lyase [Dehalococcoidia bacterium]|nr:CoA ester lyase [Dehalococcoidia bacterium]